MKFSKKTLLMAASIVLCMTMTAIGTVAYLTDRTAVANTFTVGNIGIIVDEAIVDENGISVEGKGMKLVDDDNDEDTPDVPMTRDEYTDWKNKQQDPELYGEFESLEDAARTEAGNEYKLIPNMTYDKDPTMTVKAGSEEAYLRMVIQMNCAAKMKEFFGSKEEILTKFIKELNTTDWENVAILEGDDDTLIFVFNYKNPVDQSAATEDLKLAPLFKKITIPEDLTKEQLAELAELEIEIEGQAIQTATFDDDVAAAWDAFGVQYEKTQNP